MVELASDRNSQTLDGTIPIQSVLDVVHTTIQDWLDQVWLGPNGHMTKAARSIAKLYRVVFDHKDPESQESVEGLLSVARRHEEALKKQAAELAAQQEKFAALETSHAELQLKYTEMLTNLDGSGAAMSVQELLEMKAVLFGFKNKETGEEVGGVIHGANKLNQLVLTMFRALALATENTADTAVWRETLQKTHEEVVAVTRLSDEDYWLAAAGGPLPVTPTEALSAASPSASPDTAAA